MMADDVLVEVPNPSEMLLSGRPLNCPGTCVTCGDGGQPPILAEIQRWSRRRASQARGRTTNGF
jgi:DNA repair protein RadA/Sms